MTISVLTTAPAAATAPGANLGDLIAKEASIWIGTPFVHQGRIKGRAVDCANFVALVAMNVGLTDIEIPNNYHPQEDGIEMLRLLEKYLEVIPNSQRHRGDIIAFCDEVCREPDVPRHLVIVDEVTANTTYVIDATEHGITRHRLDGRFLRRIHSCWRACA